MGIFLTEEDLRRLRPAERQRFHSPIPTHSVSNGEFTPIPQTENQKQFEARLKDLAGGLARKQGMSRRRFLSTSAGMAAAFVAMNETFGPVFSVDPAEAAEPEMANERAERLSAQYIFDDQVHFLRDDTELMGMLRLRQYAAENLNPALTDEPEIADLKFENFVKEVYLDSDTDVTLLSGAPSDSDDFRFWHLSNDDLAAARARVNGLAGSQRMLAHTLITPGRDGWLEEIDRAIEELHPDSWKGYTTGDPSGPSKHMWRLDDEKLVYPAYEKMVKAGINKVCIHKGLLPENAEERMPGVTAHANVDDLGKAARDWPQLTFIIYHSAYRPTPAPTAERERIFEETGRIDWVNDLATIPERYGVDNVYADLGACFAYSCVTNPRYCAGLLGTLIKGLGHEHVLWGTDSVWYGSPQWQIEAMRRIEIPEDLQKKFGYAPLGPADGMIKSAIFGYNGARLYNLPVKAADAGRPDKLSALKERYRAAGGERSNMAYGYVARSA